ncbi:MBL fold metallo-hydrolase [Pedobacter montanisoli]|uniref:MBL fold metallo-hydrolase n=1 Tax=Pedobacter montanisoli TaxID=2923277 RepID=A0ABS9ZYD5_9SPHI|nr:MBL fold metallo-hydrolase [Pedobacter montanisoli]MCJ0743300.1 MBL fold metallo-hydrolase [Pedobacter montanisoli]
MALYFASLNTGSNGNCFYIGNEEHAVLIDAGLSCKETLIRLNRLGLAIEKVRAIFISHEHSDHIKGLSVISKKYQIPVYITLKTLLNSGLNLSEHLVNFFETDEVISIADLNVKAFAKFHDAAEPHSFVIDNAQKKIGVFTDIGNVCENVSLHFKDCDAVFLEANYDEEMLEKGRYPYYLKHRISSGRGHLSNTKALELFKNHQSEKLRYLFLSHLSKDNNCPDLVYNLFKTHALQTEVFVASRHEETPVFSLD